MTGASMKKYFLMLMAISLISCGGSGSSSSSNNDGNNLNEGALPPGNQVEMSYHLATQLKTADGSLSLPITYPEDYKVILGVASNGTLSAYAHDFPSMVLRICKTGSTKRDCDAFTDQIGLDVDLVFDVCGADNDKNCGTKDQTLVTGTLLKDGTMSLDSVPVRARVFSITATLDGFTAPDTATGLLTFPHIVLSLSTDNVTSGSLTATGSKLSQKKATLVGGGVLPADMQQLSGADYIAMFTGTFDKDPLSFLQ
jgi:hypothetical protein